MSTMRRALKSSGLLFLATMIASETLDAQSAPVGERSMVFVIDNSGSMGGRAGTDPLKLRGVAASLVLDAAELLSKVEAGLIYFSDTVSTDGALHEPHLIRQRLQSDRLPDAQGQTNMRAALEKAISMLTTSTAPDRQVVLITDGSPSVPQSTPAQEKREILDSLVPLAVQAGIEIFALGLSRQVDEAFLSQVTGPTGGLTLLSENHQRLLLRAKELLGQHDNLFTLVNEAVPSELEYGIELPQGVDRARITVILDQPNLFDRNQLAIDLAGPDSGDGGRSYLVRKDDRDWVAAWTSFVSSAGEYVLRLTPDKPPFTDHQGIRVFVEALSNLSAEVLLSPPGVGYRVWGDEVRVDVAVARGGGPLDPNDVTVSGTIVGEEGSTTAIPFSGTQGRFEVPETSGKQTVRVIVQTSELLGRVVREVSYRAGRPDPAVLRSSRDRLEFADRLGPEHEVVEEAFKIYADSPDRRSRSGLRVGATLSVPVGKAEILVDGGVLRATGTDRRVVPETGLDVTLRIAIDPQRPLEPESAGPFRGEIRFFAGDTIDDLVIPFELSVRIPTFQVRPESLTLSTWWDPERPRTVPLGTVRSDASLDSSFVVELKEVVHAPDQGPQIGFLELWSEGKPASFQAGTAGSRVYGPLALFAGSSNSPEMRLVPADSGWRNLPLDEETIDVSFRSDLGMSASTGLTLRTLGGSPLSVPILGPLSRHGLHLVRWTFVGLGFVAALWIAARRLGTWARFRGRRPGSRVTLGSGPIRLSTEAGGEQGSLMLPGSGSDLDDTVIATIGANRQKRQTIRDRTGGRVLLSEAPIDRERELRPGDVITVIDPADEDRVLWSIEYLDGDAQSGGEVEVLENPAPHSLGAVARKFAFVCGLLLAIRWLLGTSWVATLVYRTPFIERMHGWLF